jgi:hypothetical protein
VDFATGATQLGYDFFIGSSPFVSEQTREETRARAQAREDILTHPSQLIDAISHPCREDIAAGNNAHAAGRAVFDIGTLLLGDTAALGKTGTVTTAAKGGPSAQETESGRLAVGRQGSVLNALVRLGKVAESAGQVCQGRKPAVAVRPVSSSSTVYASPVNYRAADGSMQAIDTRPDRTGDAGYAWRSGANAFEARFASASGGDYQRRRQIAACWTANHLRKAVNDS